MPRPFENATATTNDRPNSEHVIFVDVAEVNVFFDGTGNNYYNVNASQTIKDQHKKSDSYGNGLSNLAWIWSDLSLKQRGASPAVYIDGIGTTRYQDDDKDGFRYGSGKTGIVERVESSFDQIMQAVMWDRVRDGEAPHLLDINVFGFSRGAAAARHFVSLVNTRKQPFGGTWKDVYARVSFVGLFDTVSSYAEGIHPTKGQFDADFDNDLSELQLSFGEDYARRVFHLVALDEYRENFSLTTIDSALNRYRYNDSEAWCVGQQLAIPGAHSDVGGGYADQELEQRVLAPVSAIANFVYDQGWYPRPDDRPPIYGSHRQRRRFNLHERTLPNEYYKVGLAVMADKIQQHTHLTFSDKLLKPPTHPAIKEVWDAVRAFAKGEEKDGQWPLDIHLGKTKAQAFRQQFLHCSFRTYADGVRDGLGLSPRVVNGQPERQRITG